MTVLGKRAREIAGGASVSPAVSRLASAIAAGIESGKYVEIPRLGRAWIELVGSRRAQDVDINSIKSLSAELGESLAGSFVGGMIEFERAIRTLPEAVRDPDDHAQPFGTRGEWEALAPDLVNVVWQIYGDVREQLDPMDSLEVTDHERSMIEAAIQKKNPTLLRSFGSAKLVSYLLTSAAPPVDSPTPSAGTGPDSPVT